MSGMISTRYRAMHPPAAVSPWRMVAYGIGAIVGTLAMLLFCAVLAMLSLPAGRPIGHK
jgi:hypothetical protein